MTCGRDENGWCGWWKSKVELSWAAGLFEGEGTITIAIRRSDTTYRLLCIVGNTDREVIEFFHVRWGGGDQPVYGDRPGRKPAWTWSVSGPKAEEFLRDIQPYLRTERVKKKCELGLRFRDHQSNLKRVWSHPQYRETQTRMYEEMRVMNRRGVVEEESA